VKWTGSGCEFDVPERDPVMHAPLIGDGNLAAPQGLGATSINDSEAILDRRGGQPAEAPGFGIHTVRSLSTSRA
jgi:hypothetical protein